MGQRPLPGRSPGLSGPGGPQGSPGRPEDERKLLFSAARRAAPRPAPPGEKKAEPGSGRQAPRGHPVPLSLRHTPTRLGGRTAGGWRPSLRTASRRQGVGTGALACVRRERPSCVPSPRTPGFCFGKPPCSRPLLVPSAPGGREETPFQRGRGSPVCPPLRGGPLPRGLPGAPERPLGAAEALLQPQRGGRGSPGKACPRGKSTHI